MLNTIRGNDFKFTVASNISLRSLKSGKDIYYIGGTEVLPAPLEPHEEAVVDVYKRQYPTSSPCLTLVSISFLEFSTILSKGATLSFWMRRMIVEPPNSK